MTHDPTFSDQAPDWLLNDFHRANFGSATLHLDFSVHPDAHGNPDALVKIQHSLLLKGPLSYFSHAARKASAPLAGALTSATPEYLLEMLGLADRQAPGHVATMARQGLASRFADTPAVLRHLISNKRLGGVEATFQGQNVSLEEAITRSHVGSTCLNAGRFHYKGGICILPFFELHNQAEQLIRAHSYPGKNHLAIDNLAASLTPGTFEAFATFNDEGNLVDYALLRHGSPMADLAASTTLWTNAPAPSGVQSNALFISDWATEQNLEERLTREGDFLRNLDRGSRPQRFAHHEGTTIIFGPTEEHVGILFAQNAAGETIGARIKFGYPNARILNLAGHAAAQAEARLLREELPERKGETPARPAARL